MRYLYATLFFLTIITCLAACWCLAVNAAYAESEEDTEEMLEAVERFNSDGEALESALGSDGEADSSGGESDSDTEVKDGDSEEAAEEGTEDKQEDADEEAAEEEADETEDAEEESEDLADVIAAIESVEVETNEDYLRLGTCTFVLLLFSFCVQALTLGVLLSQILTRGWRG